MKLMYEISILPLLHIAVILLLLAIFATHLYLKTNIKSDLYLAICFGAIFLLPLTIYGVNGDGRVLFWSRPYHIATISVLLTMLALNWLAEKRTLQQRLPLMIVTGFITILLVCPRFISGLLCGLALLGFALWLLQRKRQGEDESILRIVFFLVLAITIILGQIAVSNALIFLFSLVLLSLLIYETLRYFGRVVYLMKNAGINSITDALTGLFNRGYLLKKSAQIISKTGKISVIFLDIDDFKNLNDTKGHDYGDLVLVKVGSILKDVLKNKGYACRYGGEEMVGLVTAGDGIKIAETLRERVEKEVGVTLSIGVANSAEIKEPTERLNEQIIKKADERMYIAKNNGKNRVVSTDDLGTTVRCVEQEARHFNDE